MRNLLRVAVAGLALLALAVARPAAATQVNAQTGTTYTVAVTDCNVFGNTLVTFNNAAGVAVTLPQAGAANSILSGCVIDMMNIGLGAVTITPTTSLINNAASLVIQSGGSLRIDNDASPTANGNYWASPGAGGSSGGGTYNNFRNLVGNGGMAVQQRGTAERTGGTTTLPSTAYSADRWGCQANVTSGQAFCAALATGPTGFSGSQSVYRKSAALTQPVCMLHEIPTVDSATVAGQNVVLSFYAKALAGMIADNGGVMNAYIFTGTGTDQGYQTMTASPAITPAWAGITSALTKAFTLTTSYQRFSFTGALPSSETELGVALCFTPTASGAGVTDGFNFSGVQLEVGTIPTPFEFRPYYTELSQAQTYYWQVAEGAAATVRGHCTMTTSGTAADCFVPFPVAMRAAPAITAANGFALPTTTGVTALNNCTGFAAATATLASVLPSLTGAEMACTNASGTTAALGISLPLFDNGGAGAMRFSADF